MVYTALRIEAGLAYAVSLDKPGFIGCEALLAARGLPLRKKLVTIVLDDPAAYAGGGETVSIGGEPVGELCSAGWGWAAGRSVALGYLRGPAAATPRAGTPVTVDLWGACIHPNSSPLATPYSQSASACTLSKHQLVRGVMLIP